MPFELYRLAGPLSVLLLASGAVETRGATAAVLCSKLPGWNSTLAAALSAELNTVGYSVTEIGFSDLCDVSALTPERFNLLVVPDAGLLPVRAVAGIEGYLKAGGDIIALNAPMWRQALIEAGGQWITSEQYQREMAGTLPDFVVFDFAASGAGGWQRGCYDDTVKSTWQTAKEGPAPGQSSLHVSVPKLVYYDTLYQDTAPNPFAGENTLTVFSARGGPNTTQLALEWQERDGSRWIAVVALSTEWRQYILQPGDFRFWKSVESRGFSGDRFKPENAVRFSVGLAVSHTTGIGPGPHEYWVGPIGTARITPEISEVLQTVELPHLDTLSPGYKLFDCRDVASIQVRPDQAIVTPVDLAMPDTVRSVQPRPTGGGFNKGRAWRWIPLIEARSANGDWRGVPAAMTVHADGPSKGGVWASFGIGDPEWYNSPAALTLIGQIARRMRDPVFLLDGGADFYTYFERQEIKLGANVVNVGSESVQLEARITCSRADNQTPARGVDYPVRVEPGSVQSVSGTWALDRWPECGYIVTCELLRDGGVVDRVAHDINVWKPKGKKSFVVIKDGEFRLDGKRWRPHGVNYMPSSGIGTEDGLYFEHWIGARAYHPEVIQRDLEHIKDLGFNSVSIFIYSESVEAQNLLDILRRLDRLGLKANLSLRPGTPMNFLWPEMKKIIEYYRLWDNDTVFAYDLAWEPMFLAHEDRKIWDREWEDWVVERYGSIENAEREWGFAAPRDDGGNVTNPAAHQIDADGEWRVMVAAYRRFLDTLLYKKYGEARRLVRTLDPNHLVSFRMAEAGNPTFRWSGRIPYDFPYLAAAVDFLGPEAYGRVGDWEHVKPGWFLREYARWADPGRPVVWTEAGFNTWDKSRMANSPERLKYVADFYRQFYKLLIESAADGVFFWWYPGGFRVGENSDYGIIEPDGTDREVTSVIREFGPRFLNGPSIKPVNYWITIDRDAHTNGVTGIYDRVQAEFWNAVESGKVPGLRTEGTSTDSCNSPRIALGHTKRGGLFLVPKYLDSAFDTVEILAANGKWTRIEKGGSIKVGRGKPVRVRVRLTNLGESGWSTDPQCAVVLRAEMNPAGKEGSIEKVLPARVERHESITLEEIELAHSASARPVDFTLHLSARGVGVFGERFRFGVAP